MSADWIARVVQTVSDVLGSPGGFVPLHEPEFRGDEWAMVKDCLDTGWVSSVGKYVDQFEAEVAAATGAAHGIAVVNGTAALEVALIVGGVRPGDEVIMPTLTFVATANATAHIGAVPHLVESSAKTVGLDPKALGAHLDKIAKRNGEEVVNRETGRRIAAIVPMHTFGHPVDMDALIALADHWTLPIVEDAAESLGSAYNGKPLGALGRVGALSFNGNKILTTGGGGAIVTNDADLAKRAKHLTTTAKTPHPYLFNHDEVGYNYRLPNLNAALGCAQMAQLETRLKQKRALAQRYQEAFAESTDVDFLAEPEGSRSNYWLNGLKLRPERAEERDALLVALNEAGLMSRPLWTPMHRLPMYADCPRAELAMAEELEARIISIPSSAHLGGFA